MRVSLKSLLAGSVATVAVWGAPVHAQVVVPMLLGLAEADGGEVSYGGSSASGDETTWTDLQITAPDGEAVITLPWVKETDLGGGSTQVTMASRGEIGFFDDGTELARIALQNDGFVYTMTRDGTATRHEYGGQSLRASRISGDVVSAFDLEFLDFAGFMSLDLGQIVTIDGALDAASGKIMYAFEVDGTVSETDTVYDGLSYAVNFSGPMADPETIESLMPYSGQLSATTGGSRGTGRSGEGAMVFDFLVNTGPSDMMAVLKDGRFDIDSVAEGFDAQFSAAAMGFPPVDLKASSASFRMGAPVAVLQEHSPTAFQFSFLDLELGEGIWNMFDPAATLPRDPMALVIDLAAMMRWAVEPMDIDNAPGMPVDVSQVAVNDITIDAMGAKIGANGLVDVTMNGPIPAGDGTLNVTVDGLMGLTGKLSQLGLVPPEVAIGARGMIGAFAVPTGEDSFKSEIVFSPSGMITANGIPLPIR